MDKINSLFNDLKQAYLRLAEVPGFPPGQVYQDAAIQRFEFTFELSWKLMQTIAIENGIQESYGPKNSIRVAAQLNYINNPEAWFKALENRNLSTHLYQQQVADTVFREIPAFISLVGELIKTVEEKSNPLQQTL
jgi:nucleotidyltransferase substrate binding protein (TIGR01987 family)